MLRDESGAACLPRRAGALARRIEHERVRRQTLSGLARGARMSPRNFFWA